MGTRLQMRGLGNEDAAARRRSEQKAGSQNLQCELGRRGARVTSGGADGRCDGVRAVEASAQPRQVARGTCACQLW
jgi:hypothetical protein